MSAPAIRHGGEVVMVFETLWLGASAYALWRGGGPEKIGGGIAGAMTLAIVGWRSYSGTPADIFDWPLFGVDAAASAGFLALAMKANRFWPLYVTGVLGAWLFSQVQLWVDPGSGSRLFLVTSLITATAVPMFLILGTWRHLRRIERLGSDPDWSENVSSPAALGA